MKINTHATMSGSANIELIGPNGERKEYLNDECTLKNGDNIGNDLLNSFFTALTDSETYNSTRARINMGTGTSPTNLAWTELESFYKPLTGYNPHLNSPNYINSGVAEGDYFVLTGGYIFDFVAGQLVGNFTELGIDFNSSITNSSNESRVNTRLLIRDSLGNPTAISIKEDEQLRVTYILKARIPLEPHVDIIPYIEDGVESTITVTTSLTGSGIFTSLVSPYFSPSSSGSARYIYATQNSPSTELNELGNIGSTSRITSADYSSINNVNYRYAEFGTTDGNLEGGIGGFVPDTYQGGIDSAYLMYKWGVSPKINKLETQKLSFNFATTFSREGE